MHFTRSTLTKSTKKPLRYSKLAYALKLSLMATLTLPTLNHAFAAEANKQLINGNNINSVKAATNFEQTKSFNISAGPLNIALIAFAKQADIYISSDSALTANKKSQKLTGKHSIELALKQLLTGTALTFVKEANGSYRVVTNKHRVMTLATTQVSGYQETATSSFEGYVTSRSATGTKTDTPLIETPQSITVVGATEITIRKAQSLMDVLSYSAGIARLEGADKTTDSFMLRGFQAGAGVGSIYRDGKRFMANVYDGGQEPYGLERIELLKGAASLLYGASAPGGIINTISKRPTEESIAEVGVELGNSNRKQLTADFSGMLAETSDWSYRLTLLERDSDSFIDYVPDNRTYIAPALKWQASEETSLTLLSHFQKSETAYSYGLPAEGTINPNPNGNIPRNRFTGEPGEDSYESKNTSIGYLFDHSFNEQLSIHHSINYFNADVVMPSHWIWGLQNDMRHTASRGFNDRQDKSSVLTSDTYINFDLDKGNHSHKVTAGIDITHLEHSTERYSRTLESLDLYNPKYGQAIGEPTENLWSSKKKTKRVGLYLQDQIKLQEKWLVVLGLRQEWFEDEKSPFFGDTPWKKEKTDALTGNAGLVYLAENGFAPFISYSQSFELQSGESRHNTRFEPTEGEQIETGIRYQPDSENWLLSASIYQLVQSNVTTSEPGYPDFKVQTGEVTSKGFELEFKGRLTDELQIISAYAYTDARTTKDNVPENIDKRTGAVPYNQLSLWADYQFSQFNLPGLTLGAGARYVGETRGVWLTGKVPAFTLIDAMMAYESNNWRYALNVSNLTDKTYIASCTYGCFYGEGRKVIASVNYSF